MGGRIATTLARRLMMRSDLGKEPHPKANKQFTPHETLLENKHTSATQLCVAAARRKSNGLVSRALLVFPP